MKKELKLTCLTAVVVACSAFFAGCDKKAEAAPEAVSVEAADAKAAAAAPAEAQLQPTDMKVGETGQTVDAKDPKIWAFLPDVVAEANGKKITKGEFIDYVASQMPDGKMPPMMISQLQSAAPALIKSYVDLPLVLGAAEKAGFKPSKEAIVKLYKEQIAKMSEKDLEVVKAQFAQQNKTIDSYIDEIASNAQAQQSFAIGKYLDKEINSSIKITDEQAKREYEMNKDMFKTAADPADAVRASHILIAAEKTAKPEDIAAAKKKAEDILAAIRKDNKQFETFAQKESACPSGKQNGSLGLFQKGQMVKEFEDTAFALKEGEISNVVQTDFGFHIIRRDPARKASILPFEQVKAGIIENLKAKEYSVKLEALLGKLEKDAKVKFFVKGSAAPTVPAAAK